MGAGLSLGLLCGSAVGFLRWTTDEAARAYLRTVLPDVVLSYLQHFVNQTTLLVVAVFLVAEVGIYFARRAFPRLAPKSSAMVIRGRRAPISMLLPRKVFCSPTPYRRAATPSRSSRRYSPRCILRSTTCFVIRATTPAATSFQTCSMPPIKPWLNTCRMLVLAQPAYSSKHNCAATWVCFFKS